MKGKIDILNCADGHTEIRVDSGGPIEKARGAAIIKDMLARGYTLFVHGEGDILERVERYDEAKHVYIVAAAPIAEPVSSVSPSVRSSVPVPAEEGPLPRPTGTAVSLASAPKRRGRPPKTKATKEVPVKSAHVTAIARTAGG